MALVVAAVAASALVAVALPTSSLRARAEAAVQSLSAAERSTPGQQAVVSVALTPPAVVLNPGSATKEAAREARTIESPPLPHRAEVVSMVTRRSASPSPRGMGAIKGASHDEIIAPQVAPPPFEPSTLGPGVANQMDNGPAPGELNDAKKVNDGNTGNEANAVHELGADDVLPPSVLQ